MDPASIAGIVLILLGVFVGSVLKGVSPAAFFTIPAAFLIVFVASFGAVFLSNTMEDAKNFFKVFLTGLKGKKLPDAGETVDLIVSFAEQARKEGLLSLEERATQIDDPFFRRGLQLAVDGADPDMVAEVMESEVKAMSERHKTGAKMMTAMGVFSPTFGIIGAVIGLIATLSNLSDPASLGEHIAAAFITTFWGVFAANGIFLPIGNKLTSMSAKEIAYKRLIIEGVLSIQSGANPRLLDDMLRSSLPPKERAAAEERKSA
jgi:chemotaxis protein MotA